MPVKKDILTLDDAVDQFQKKEPVKKDGKKPVTLDQAVSTFEKKKDDGTSGETSTTPSSQSKLPSVKKGESPFDYKPQLEGGLTLGSKKLRAKMNYDNKKLTPEDTFLLSMDESGKQKGLDKLDTEEKRKLFTDLHNQPDASDLVDSVREVVNKYPFAPTKEGQAAAQKVLQSFNTGDTKELLSYKDAIIDRLSKQIPQKTSAGGASGAYGAEKDLTPEQLKRKSDLESEIKNVNQVFSDYVDNVNAQKKLDLGYDLVDSEIRLLGKDREKMLLGNNSFKQRQLLSSPENKQYQRNLESLQKSNLPADIKKAASMELAENAFATENVNYDREKTGLEMILNKLTLDYNEVAKKSLTTNPELAEKADKLFEQLKYYRTMYNGLDDKPEYSGVRVSKTARFIGDEFVKRHGSMGIASADDIRKTALEVDKENPGFLGKYGSDIDYLEKHTNMIPMAGFKGGAKAGLYDVGKNIATGFGYLGGSDREEAARDISDEYKTNIKGTGWTEPTRIVFDKDDNAYRELPNEDYGKLNWNNTFRFLGKSAPGLAEFILLDKGLGAAAKVVNTLGVRGLVGLSEASARLKGIDISAEEIAAAKKALSIGQGTQNSLGLFGAVTITGHEQNRKIADDLIDDKSSNAEAKKTLLANLLNLSSFAAFKLAGITPSAVVEKALQKGVANDALQLFEKEGWKLSEKETENFFNNSVLPKLKSIGATLADNVKSGSKLGGAMVLDANTRALIGNIVNPDKSNVPSLKDDAEMMINQVILMTAAGLPGLVSSGFTPTNKDALYEAGLRFPEQIFRINKMVESGELDRDKANELIAMTKTMGEEVYKVQSQTNEKGLPLTIKQKRDIAVENFRKRAAEKLKEQGHDVKSEKIISESDNNIKEIKAYNGFEPVALDENGVAQKTEREANEEWKKNIQTIGERTDINDVEKEKLKEDEDLRHAEELSSLVKPEEKVKPEKQEEEKIDFTGKDNNFLANKEEGFFNPQEREQYNELMKKPETEDRASQMVNDRKEELKQERIKPKEKVVSDPIERSNEDVVKVGDEVDTPNGKGVIDSINSKGAATVKLEDGSKMMYTPDLWAGQNDNTNPVTKDTEVKNVSDAIKKHDEVENYTFDDMVNDVESIANETNNPKLIDAVDKYRKAQSVDAKLSGRGDMDAAQKEFSKEVANEQTTPTAEVKAGKDLTFEGVKRADAKMVYKSIGEMDEPTDAAGLAYNYIAGGGKINPESLLDEVTGSKNKAQLNTNRKEAIDSEIKARDYIAKDAPSIKEAAHTIWDSLPEHLKDKISDQDIRNSLIDVVGSHNKRLDAANAYVEKYNIENNLTEPERLQYEKELPSEEEALSKWILEESDREYENEQHLHDEELINHIIDNYDKGTETTDQQAAPGKEGASGEATGEEHSIEPDKPTKEAAAEGIKSEEPVVPEPPPPSDTIKPISDVNPDSEEWTAIRKEEIMTGAKLAQRGFDTGGVVSREESVQSGLRRLAAEGDPTRSLYENASDKVDVWADRVANEIRRTGKSLFNPNDEELAQMLYHRTATQERMAGLFDKMNSDSDTQRRLAIAEFQGLRDELAKVDYVLNETGRVGGRAFGFKQMEGKLDPEYGLQIRRMELAQAKGDKLTDEELSWVFDQWQKEHDLSARESELKQKGMQEEFDKKMEDLHKEYEQKLKDASKGKPQTAKEKTLSQKGKDIADKIRNLKLGGTKVDFTFGTWNLAVEGIAKLVEAGSTIAEAIDTLIKEGTIGFKTDKDKTEFENTFVRVLGRGDALARIKENAELNKVSGITPEMVSKKMIQEYVDAHIGEVEPKDILKTATDGLKEIFPDITEGEVRKAYLKEYEFKQPTKQRIETDFKKDKDKLTRLAKIEKDLADLKEQQDIHRRGNNKSKQRQVDSDIEKTEKALKKEMNDQGVKYSNEDKFTKASNETRAKLHNDRVDVFNNKLKDKIQNGNLSSEQIDRLTKLNNIIDQTKIELNPQSKLSQKQVVHNAAQIIRKIKSEFERGMKMDDRLKLSDVSKGLQRILDKFDSDKYDTEQTARLERLKNTFRNDNAERLRKLNAGEFDEEVARPLKKTDAELIKLQKERNQIDSQYRKKQKELNDKNRSFVRKAFQVVRSAYVMGLIYKFGTMAKVTATSLLRPNIEAGTKATFGNIFKVLFPQIAQAAKGGGESSSWRSIAGMYGAYFKQMGEKKMNEIYDKANEKYESSARAYYEFKKNNPGQENKKLKDQMYSDMIDAQANLLYKYIGGSSIQDAWDAFVYRSNAIEREFGYSDVEKFKGEDVAGKISYILNIMGRSHSAIKTFSGRANFAGGFIARLEGAVADGVDITKPDRILEIANESYLDWERGKYQQANFVTDAWNSITRGLEKYDEGGEWSKYSKAASEVLKFDVAITRVPVNILHEAVAEYTVGAFRSFWKAAQEYRKAKKEVLMNDNLMPGTEEFKAAVKDQLKTMDKTQAALIARCFRKGGFGLGLFALSTLSGLVHFGGFHHKGEQKKKEDELDEYENNPGEIMFGDNRVGHLMSKIIEHQPAAFASLLGLNAAKVYNDKIERGETTFSAAKDAIMSDLESIQDAIPQTKVINPIQISKDVTKAALHQMDSFWEPYDVDENGDFVTRKALTARDELNLAIGRRGEVLTEENYKKALSIKRTYTTAIKNAHKTKASQEEIDTLIKERDDLIEQLYEQQKNE